MSENQSAANPMQHFLGKRRKSIVAGQPVGSYIQSPKEFYESLNAPQKLRELAAYVEWVDYYVPIVSDIFDGYMNNRDSEDVQIWVKMVSQWSQINDAEKINFLKFVLQKLSESFDITPPILLTRSEWNEIMVEHGWDDAVYTEEKAQQYFMIYQSATQEIIILIPDFLSFSPWHCVEHLSHEFAHHLLRVQAKKLFDDLSENVDRLVFAEEFYFDRELISNHPLCNVISCCEEYRDDPAYREIYSNRLNIETNQDKFFLEEILADEYSWHYTTCIREAITLIKAGFSELSSQALGHILLDEAEFCIDELQNLSKAGGVDYQTPPELEDLILEIKKERGKTDSAPIAFKVEDIERLHLHMIDHVYLDFTQSYPLSIRKINFCADAKFLTFILGGYTTHLEHEAIMAEEQDHLLADRDKAT